MIYNQYLVAFIDILGFRNLVENHFSGKNIQALESLTEALKNAESFAIDYNKKYLNKFNIKFSFKQFSDCVSISMPFSQKHSSLTIIGAFINVIRIYQFILLENKIMVRGGISMGGHIENSNMIFSEALVRSYNLESQKAIYPRIIIDNKLLTTIRLSMQQSPNEQEELYKLYLSCFIRDWDDEVFISPFGFGSEIQFIQEKYGAEIIKDMIDIGLQANNIDKAELGDELYDELNDSNTDYLTINSILDKINEYIVSANNEKPEVLIKYKWLRQFLIWNLAPKKSHINFERYFEPKGLVQL